MVYIKNWTDFESAATDLYVRSPNKVRYCVKLQPKTGHLVLKVTDNVKCIKYKTFSSIILNRFDSLNLRLLSLMSNTKAKPRPALTVPSAGEAPKTASTPAPAGSGSAMENATVQVQQGASVAPATGGGKTNKSGKKKKKGKR
ncbi:hypothetical protein L204_103108 [Cryptococcus depauperatus]|nr:signal recognition particle subunit SRP9 [Cryptococcus depauperatus CBS 7855]